MEDNNKKFRESINIRYFGDNPFDEEEALLNMELKKGLPDKKTQKDVKAKKTPPPYSDTIKEVIDELLER